MLTQFYVDQARTFGRIVFVSCEPKTRFGSDEQDRTKDGGVPKWVVQCLATYCDQFGQTQNELLKIGIDSHTRPDEGVAPLTEVKLDGFQVGVMARTNQQGQMLGVQTYFKADAIVPAVQDVPAKKAS